MKITPYRSSIRGAIFFCPAVDLPKIENPVTISATDFFNLSRLISWQFPSKKGNFHIMYSYDFLVGTVVPNEGDGS
jgi:hypothetical protein